MLGLARTGAWFLLGMRPSMAGAALLMLASLFEVATGQAGCPTQTKVRLSLLRTGPALLVLQLESPRALVGGSRTLSHTRRLPAVPLAPPLPTQFEAALMGMYDFATADKLLRDKLLILSVRQSICATATPEHRRLHPDARGLRPSAVPSYRVK